MIENPRIFSKIVVRRSAIIFFVAAVPLVMAQEVRLAAGVLAGTVLALVNFILIRLPFELLADPGVRKKIALIVLGFFARIVAVGAGIFLLVHLRFVNIAGIFAGVTIPLVAISTFVVWKGSVKWKV